MPTECSRDLFGYEGVEGRRVVAAFDGGEVTSDAGALLLGATDRAIGLVRRFAACFVDGRAPAQVEHSVATMVAQRVFGIALGYEDLIDHDQLRHDPVLATLAGKLEARRKGCAPLAGKSTLEPARACAIRALALPQDRPRSGSDRGSVRRSLPRQPHHRTAQIILDLDATDDPLHGHQEGRFFHGYYDCYCYLPLYVFCGKHLLAAKLRRSNIDASAGAKDEVERIVGQIRAFERWQTDASCLTLELTESALMADPDTAMTVLKRVADLGCRLSLDDFGTGYSSLAYLQRLPIDELKIDRSFVATMTEDDNAAVVVRSVIKLAKSLGLTVVAEGVESEDAFAWLSSLGCDQMQGFYLGQAMTSEALLAWLKESPWGPDLQQSRDRMQSA